MSQRQRLSWDKEKTAEIEKKADPYTMNQNHANNPVEKYKTGDPSTWAESPDMKTPWKNEGRTETGHPAPEHTAVMAARKLEDKAIKCITIAQRMLPGATDQMIEAQATDLMYLPEKCILATVQRQSGYAELLAGKKDEDDDDADASASKKEDEDDDDADASASKKEDEDDADASASKKEDEDDADASASKKEDDDDADASASKKAKKEKKDEVVESKKKAEEAPAPVPEPKKEEKKEEVEAKKVEAPVPEPKKEDAAPAPAPEVVLEDKKEAGDLLDMIFAEEVTDKQGAKKLSGLVKQASIGDSNLANIWDAPPDVSKNFR